MKQITPIMGHLVLGYPTLLESIQTAFQYVQAGIQILELQIPFSHPTADGPVITAACQEAIERQHISVDDCLVAIKTIRAKYPQQEIMVMSYLNRVFAYGPEHFTAAMSQVGVKHLIIPDLPVDSSLALSFMEEAANKGFEIKLVPVLAANVPDVRLDKLLNLPYDFYYLMSDFKITGASFSLHPRLQAVIGRIKAAKPSARIGIGFGISTPEQARLVTETVEIAIIGSALIKAQQAGALSGSLAAFVAG
ncbi:MAG: tryptophan synthase subunit alpha [Bacteroidota bacterium]